MNKKTSQTKEELLSKISQLESMIYASEKSKINSNKWFENSPVCTQLIDLDFNLKYINKSGIRDLKINDVTEFYGKPYPLSFFPDSFMIPMIKNLKRAKKTGETITLEAPTLDMEGNTLWYYSTIVPVYNNQNHLDHIMIVSLKTTARQQAGETLIKDEAIISDELKTITEPEVDMGSLELSDIIDTEILQNLLEDFYRIAGMAVAVLDVSGKVLVSVGWQEICTKFHRCNPKTLKNCIESDTILTQGVPEGTCKSYHCKNNMWDIVTPLILGGKHLGNIFMGQYFLEGEVPEVEIFRKQAKKYGFDEKEYLTALDKVPRFSKETVNAGMKFYSNLANIISSLSYSSIQQSKMLKQQKLADQALRESENKYRNLINLAQEGIWVIDENNITNFVNPSMAKILGYSSKEMIGKSLFYFMDEKGIRLANENLEQRKKGLNDQHDFEFIRKNGNRIFCTITTAPILDKSGNYKGAIAGIIDITERKQAENKSRATEENIKKTFDMSPSIIAKANIDTGYFIEVNQAVTRILGYTAEEFTSKPLIEFIHPDDKQKTTDEASKQMLGKKTTFFENRYLCKDGSYKWMSWNSTQPDDNRIVTAIASDITEQKQAEEKIKNSEKRLKTILNSSPFPVAVVDVNDNIIRYWSISAIQLFGHNPKTSTEWYELAYPDPNYRNDVIQRWKPFLETAKKSSEPINTGEYYVVCKDGSTKICEIYAQFIPGNLIVTFNDITERKHAEEKIRTTEENLKNTFNLSPSIICKANLDAGHFIEANQAVTRILGYTVEEFTSRPFNEFIHPDDQQKSADEKSEQLEGNDVTFFENRYLCKDGSYKWMAWHATKADENGIATAIASDISKRKIIEQKIAETKQFYENIIEGVQDGIWVTNKDDVIFYANSAMEKIAGVPREQIYGNNILNDSPKETIGEFSKFYKQAKKEKKTVWYEIQAKTLAKKDVYQNGWLIPLYQNNKFSGIICTVRDITERKKAEGSVRQLSTAVQQSPSSILITDTKGKLEYVNPKFTELTGYSSSEVIGKELEILRSGEHDLLFYAKMWEIVDSGKVWRGQFHNKKKNGELYWEAASISAILNESGDIINYIKIGEDISQQKNTEAELKIALEKALESDKLKSAFLANMSHEIRTPMNGILGFVNLLNEPNLIKSKADKYSSIINKSGERLLNTINDIIDISKIEAGETIITNTETSINNIMEELHSFFTPEANQKGLSLTIEPSLSAEPIMVITDGNKIHGILSNLIKNAIKYTAKGHVTFGYLVKENFIDFFVKDSGVGIPKNRLQAIFNRFEQADIEDSRVFEGSGLGLAISKAYTEMLGGNIFAESTFGKGSKFEFNIPYTKITKQKPEQVSAYSDNNIIKIENLNLLIAEDDIISSELLKSSLQGLFKEITIVDNGIDAIEACRNKPEINLVLMDIKMPKMNGHDATTEIRKFNKDLVIIAQTAYALRGDKEKAIEAGCNDYITKPINKKLLLEIINKFID